MSTPTARGPDVTTQSRGSDFSAGAAGSRSGTSSPGCASRRDTRLRTNALVSAPKARSAYLIYRRAMRVDWIECARVGARNGKRLAPDTGRQSQQHVPVDRAMQMRHKVVGRREIDVVRSIGAARDGRAYAARRPRGCVGGQHHGNEVSGALRRVGDDRNAETAVVPDALDRIEVCFVLSIVCARARFGHVTFGHRLLASQRFGAVDDRILEDEQMRVIEPLREVVQHEGAAVAHRAPRPCLERGLHCRVLLQAIAAELEQIAGVIGAQFTIEAGEIRGARRRRISRCGAEQNEKAECWQHG